MGQQVTVNNVVQVGGVRNAPVIEVFRVLRADGNGHLRVIAWGTALPSGKVVMEWGGGRRSLQVFDSINDAMRAVSGRSETKFETVGAYPVVDSFDGR